MKIQNIEVTGFEAALRGMRNPKESWDRSDSYFGYCDNKDIGHSNPITRECGENDYLYNYYYNNGIEFVTSDIYKYTLIGDKDMKLAQALIKGGTEHRKFLRMIHLQADLTAPLYIWKEWDTYKIATVANSTSTMHKIQSNPITIDCFETDDIEDFERNNLNRVIDHCESLRELYNETGDKKYWKALIRTLPESWLQTRTIDINYETLLNMYFQRKNHKLTEWHTICEWIYSLPYMSTFISFLQK